MKVPFACPSCGASGSVDANLVGQHVRCKQCQYRFAILAPGADPEVYTLDPTTEDTAGMAATIPPQSSVYVPSRGDESNTAAAPRVSERSTPKTTRRAPRGHDSGFAWRTWLTRGVVVAVVVIAAIALLAPRGTMIAGCVMMFLGSGMVLVGFAAGAFGAFSEDVLHGILYLVIPLYTAYYILTRWDDLWVWFACSTAGAALVLLGTEMLRWAT